MINQIYIYNKLHQKNFLFFSFILVLLSIFFAPTHISGNEYGFITRSMNFFNQNENFIGYSESIRVAIIRIPFYFYYELFGFEVGWKITRILSLILYSFAFYHFSLSFKFSNLTILIGILIFILAGQGIFRTAFLFGTFESKVISNIAVIFSLSYLQREKYLKSIILISIAIYSHFLVGYFWFGIICVYYYLKEKDLKIIFKYFTKVFLITLPVLLILVFENYFINLNVDVAGFNMFFLDRVDGLTNPFTEDWNLKKDWILGYIIILINILLLIFLKSKIKNNINNNFFLLIILLNLYFIFLTIILYFDRGFILAKFIPFRPESFTLLFSLFIITELCLVWFYKQTPKKKIIILFTLILFCCSPALFNYKYNLIRVTQILIQKAFFVSTNFYKPLNDYLEIDDVKLINWAKNKTSENEIIIFEDGKNYTKTKQKEVAIFVRGDNYVLSRVLSSSWETISNRPAYVNRDVVGGNIKEIIEWHKRLEQKNKVYKGDCKILKHIPILYIVAFKEESKMNLDRCLTSSLINFGKYSIYKNNK